MGTYLSAPVLDKHTETGSELGDYDTPVRWAVVDMQGWRKSMEDAHVARTDVPLPQRAAVDGGGGGGEPPPTHAKVFAVFDGHGGAEVARFCSIHLVPTLTSRDHWRGGSGDDYAAGGNGSEARTVAACVSDALIESFHALDALIDDPNWRPEIEKWRTARPPPYVSGGDVVQEVDVDVDVDVDADADDAIAQDAIELLDTTNAGVSDAKAIPDDEIATENEEVIRSIVGDVGGGEEVLGAEKVKGGMNTGNSTDLPSILADDSDEEDEVFEDSLSEQATDADELDNKESDGIVRDDSEDEKVERANDNDDFDGEVDGTVVPSTAAVGGASKGTMVLSANDAVALFQKLLRMNGTDEGDDDDIDDDDDEDVAINGGILNGFSGSAEGAVSVRGDRDDVVIPTKAQLLNPPTGIVAQSASVPTRIQNGRKVSHIT
jgi:hypothetical protein